ncbi:MAG: acyl-[acyl-carrier-protein]--UDP-N-acetylglucosamine O-acyltransferase [Candidatus Neomarinimicrobiota bacterium]|nr:MAG: acyl-[acyl-carrier-protein]--UDP-N-acetylglucosamine O-acyltransferase [Candidatus Neomarinimicrobiota bacterium]
MENIHPTAIIHPEASIGKDVTISPYSWINKNVTIGDNSQIGSHTVLLPGTHIGKECKVLHHAVLGEIPQDLKFGGETTTVEIGDRTTIREFVTVNRGTKDHWKTVVGSDCLIMAYAHIAHDCIVGNNVIMANAVNLSGHVEIENWAIIGGMVGVHQFVKIGQHSFIGGHYRVTKDIPPYIIAAGEPIAYHGINIIGLRRRGFTSETIRTIKQIYQLIFRSDYNVSDAIEKIENEGKLIPEIQNVVKFIKNSERGIIKGVG